VLEHIINTMKDESPLDGQVHSPTIDLEGESEEARLERKGRERPEKFQTTAQEVGFVFAVVCAQLMSEFYVSGFIVLIPTLATELNIPPESTTWPAGAFSLVVSTFLLPLGRIADMYGAYPVYVGGIIWTVIWSIIAGFSTNEIMLDVCRAFQGFGPAAFLPASMALLGTIYRPGPRKNLVFSIYGAMAPLGFFAGIFFAGISAQFANWRCYFWIGAIISAFSGLAGFLTIPSDVAERRAMNVKMDWLGTFTISVGIILVVFALTGSSGAPHGWGTSYIIATMVIGVIFLGLSVYVEGWVAEAPLLPPELFKIKYMKPLVLALLLTYGGCGIYLLYATNYMSEIMNGTPMQLVAWWSPAAIGGCIIATVGGFVLHLLPGTILIGIASVAWIVAPLLFALVPVGGQNFWPWVFPAMVCCTIGIDITFNVTNIFITTSLPSRQQGLAGALINVLLQLGIAVALGLADITVAQTAEQGVAKKYKNAFWLEVGLAGAALVVFLGFVKVDKAKSQATADEKVQA
jgi:MFS family permease